MGQVLANSTSVTLNEAFVPFAQGAGSVTIQPEDYNCEYAVLSSAAPGAFSGGVRLTKGQERSLDLAAGEFLHLRGRGVCRIIAEVPYP